MESDEVQSRKPREDGLRTRKAILPGGRAGHGGRPRGSQHRGPGQGARHVKERALCTFRFEAGPSTRHHRRGRAFFELEVIEPALAVAGEGLPQLLSVCDRFFEHLRRHTFPGGCFFASAILEMGTRPGPVKERIGLFQQRFVRLIFGFARRAQESGQIPPDEDLTLLVFDLNGIILAANASFVMTEDTTALDIARRAVADVEPRTRRRIPSSEEGDHSDHRSARAKTPPNGVCRHLSPDNHLIRGWTPCVRIRPLDRRKW